MLVGLIPNIKFPQLIYLCYMNFEKLLDFIKEKRGYKYPIKYKLINGLPITEDELTVDGNLKLTGKKITSLPDNLNVGGNLNLLNTKITFLPDNLRVGGILNLHNTNITSLPNNLYVGGFLVLSFTPLSKKYSEDEFRKMIKDKGGYVNGVIDV